MPQAMAQPGKTLLSPADHILIMIDHQSQMAFASKSIDAVALSFWTDLGRDQVGISE